MSNALKKLASSRRTIASTINLREGRSTANTTATGPDNFSENSIKLSVKLRPIRTKTNGWTIEEE
jgi:hypothetical protein